MRAPRKLRVGGSMYSSVSGLSGSVFLARHFPLLRQIVYFGVVGTFVTMVNTIIYWVCLDWFHKGPNLSFTIGFIVALAIGYALQSQLVFKPEADVSRFAASLRYVAVALLGFALNSFWVWAMVTHFRLAPWSPIPLTIFVTPLVTFGLNRLWVFR